MMISSTPKEVAKLIFLVPDRTDRKWPLLRGKMHLALVYLCPLWIWPLLSQNTSPRALFSATVAVLSLFLNFSASALLHNFDWPAKQGELVSKLDYAGIFLMISGSCAPVLMVWSGWLLFCAFLLQWTPCLIGFYMIFFYGMDHFSGKRAYVFVFVGLLNLALVTEILRHLLVIEWLSLLFLAISYIFGAAVYARKWPDPWPQVFGYHEIMHTLCLVSLIFTFIVDISVLRRLK